MNLKMNQNSISFMPYGRIFLFYDSLFCDLACYTQINEITVRFTGIGNNASRISNCNSLEQVYETYNPRFICLK